MRRAPTSTEEFERRPKTARKSEIDTKTKLLNAAERLFSDKGIEAVSHRDIALAAAVNLAALNFGSKQAFIRAVIKRRVEPINAHRLAALARAARQMGGAPVPTDKILEAFLGPPVGDPNGSFQSSLWIGPARYLCFSLAILAFMLAGPRYLPGFLPSFANCMNESVITQRMIKLVCGGLYGQAV